MLPSSRLLALLAGLFVLTLASEPRRAAAADAYGDPLPQRAKVRIGTTRFRHGDTVTAAAFCPDGRTVATASRDGTLSLWETESGKERVRFRGHAGAVLALAFPREGEQLISGGADGTVRFWRVPRPPWNENPLAGEEARCFHLSREEVQTVALSADGSTAAAGTADGVLVVWDLNSDKERHRFTQEGQVYCLALSADGKQLAANQAACGAVLWDTLKGEVRHRLGAGAIASLAFSPDGRTVAAGYQHDRFVLWDTRRGTELGVLSGREQLLPEQAYGVLSVCYSADGRRLATGGTDNLVRVWDVETGRQTSVAKGHGENVTTVAFDSDGKRLISGGADNSVRLWEAATGRSLTPEREPAMPLTSVSLTPDGRTLALIASGDRLALWDTSACRQRPLPSALNDGRASAAAFRPLGQTLAVAGADGRLRFCDLAARTVLSAEGESPRRLERLVWSRDGKTLASYGPDHHIDLWDPRKAELLQHMGLQEEAYLAVAFDRQGDRLATASEADVIRLWERATGMEKPSIAGHFAGALALSFSADGRSLHAAGNDGRVRLWELATNQARLTFPREATPITAAAFTPDGRFLATGNSDGTVRLWDTTAGKERHAFRGHRGPITMLIFAAQAPLLASSSRDTTAILWDLADLLHTETLPTRHLSEKQIEQLWTRLAGDAPAAYDALQTLRSAPHKVVPYLRGRMQPVKIDVARLIADLDSDEFSVREKASQQLARYATRYGRLLEKPLRETLEKKPSPEVRRRIQDLLMQMRDTSDVVRASPREVRCIELLESIGSAEARRVLQTLAGGIAEAELTQEAKASLARLARRVPPIAEPGR
jgi:WD40 repeat protein